MTVLSRLARLPIALFPSAAKQPMEIVRSQVPRYNSLNLGSPIRPERSEKSISKSTLLRVEYCRAIVSLVGECRELGDDGETWRRHFIERVAGLAGAELGVCGEQAGCLASRARDL